jgi:uncharacterized protein
MGITTGASSHIQIQEVNMLRASSYNIYVDLPDNPEEMLLVHGYSGAYDKVSRRVATYVRSLEAGRPPKPLFGEWRPEAPIAGEVIPPADETIAVLKRRGYLTEMTIEAEQAFFSTMATTMHQYATQGMPSYIFMPTYNCNLRCSYCFQDHMRTDPRFHRLLRPMQRSMVDRLFTAMRHIETHHGVPKDAPRRRQIGLFGGEPLLESNRPIVEYIVHKALEFGETRFWSVTNGTDLHMYRDLLGPSVISRLQVTLDGPPREHDKRRIYANGQGSFERIARNITMALDLGVQVSVRLNIDRNNIRQVPALADEIMARGWDRYQEFSTYTAPIHAANTKTDMHTTFGSWELNQALQEMHQHYPNMQVIRPPDDGLTDRARQLFEQHWDPLPNFKASFCGAHNRMYIFDAFGDIYACWERTGDPSIRIGSVTEAGDVMFNDGLHQLWRNRTVTSNPICRKCRYAFYCGGGCAVLAMDHTGKFHTNYCDSFLSTWVRSIAELRCRRVMLDRRVLRRG